MYHNIAGLEAQDDIRQIRNVGISLGGDKAQEAFNQLAEMAWQDESHLAETAKEAFRAADSARGIFPKDVDNAR